MTRKLLLALLIPAMACTAADDYLDDVRVKGDNGKDDASAEAVFLDFSWDGELLTGYSYNHKKTIEDQLLYTIGHLNGDRSLGRLDKLVLTDIKSEQVEGKTRLTYHAVMPVAWASRNGVPETYAFTMPLDMSYAAIGTFAEKYGESCVDWGAHDVTSGSMWYYFRPNSSRCDLDPADITTAVADLSPSTIQTNGKYPEYHKIWEDDTLRVVAIFGKNEAGATSGDPGISAFNSMASKLANEFEDYDLVTIPAEVPSNPGAAMPDVTFSATLPDGKKVEAVILLVDGVRVAGPEFDARYEALSGSADFIAYAGHSGLGANIRALASKGSWRADQYVIVDMNGCDTYAYVDSSLADAHSAVNDDDPDGTKYLDIVTNAMPAHFSSNANNLMSFVRGLMSYDAPKTFEQIFAGVDSYQVILVSGEEDNVYVPGYDPNGGGEVEEWDGLSESGAVAKGEELRFETPRLEAGRYLFEMTGTNDADLYVRVGEAPTQSLYDCRPYRWGSNETCEVELPSPAPIHVMVRGWDQSSEFELVGRAAE